MHKQPWIDPGQNAIFQCEHGKKLLKTRVVSGDLDQPFQIHLGGNSRLQKRWGCRQRMVRCVNGGNECEENSAAVDMFCTCGAAECNRELHSGLEQKGPEASVYMNQLCAAASSKK
jgi:hypothetical protein